MTSCLLDGLDRVYIVGIFDLFRLELSKQPAFQLDPRVPTVFLGQQPNRDQDFGRTALFQEVFARDRNHRSPPQVGVQLGFCR